MLPGVCHRAHPRCLGLAGQCPLVLDGARNPLLLRWHQSSALTSSATCTATCESRASWSIPFCSHVFRPSLQANLNQRSPSASMPSQTSIHFRSEEHTSELQSQSNLVCRLLLEKI